MQTTNDSNVEDQNASDTTDELLRDPARRERLLRAVEDVRIGRNIITPDQTLFD